MNDGSDSAEQPSLASGNTSETSEQSETHRAFLDQLNHKLRTPLNAIIGYAELLALQPRGGRQDADVQQILKAARELLGVIEHELAESRETPQVRRIDGAVERRCDVLYVEDDIVNFTLVERILELRPDLNLMHAPKGQLGIDLAHAYRPKLILLDLNLPDMHGAEVLQRLQQNTDTSKIPVVVLSANATPSQIERLLTAGARNYLTKPFDIDPFLAVVDDFVASNS